jgi:hypothetical protein
LIAIRVLPLFLILAACGVDGAPSASKVEPPAKPGVTVSGDAQIGVVVK